MFRTLIYPSSGASDYAAELPHWSLCSWFVVCWRFGVVGLEWYPCYRLQPATRTLLKPILETSKPLKSSATAHARITKSLFQHFKRFTLPVLPNLTQNLMHTLCSSTSTIPPITENCRRLMQYTHKETCNNQTLPHPTRHSAHSLTRHHRNKP